MMMSFNNYLFVPDKARYIEERRRVNECVICRILAGDKNYKDLIVYRDSNFSISLNLYPYNPGHVMIFPDRHIEDLRELTDDEAKTMHWLITLTMDVLSDEYSPAGFNVGYNIGKASGASISHLHCHIVPRYANELGMMDIIAGTRVIVEDVDKSYKRLKKAFERQQKRKK
ncbi:MAG TPA: HIT domain-containing protein [Firmicutes bacterium]|nr:HIT domain-containing protein [Bacillota bacterium]